MPSFDETLDALGLAQIADPKDRQQLKGILQHYAKMPHPFTACVRDNKERFGAERAERICATIKDTIRGTTKWRGKGKLGEENDALQFEDGAPVVTPQVAVALELMDDATVESLVASLAEDPTLDPEGAQVPDIAELAARVLASDMAPDSIDVELDDDGVGSHVPSPGMRAAAKRGIALVAQGKAGDLDGMTLARARKIAAGEPLGIAHVAQVRAFFDENQGGRKPGWGKPGSETAGYVAWLAWGGDPGYVWAKKNAKAVDLSDEGTYGAVGELYLADSKTDVDKDGLVWKTVLRVGRWKLSPSASGPIEKPLVVVEGRSADPKKVIGLQDIVDNFHAGAVEHVTVPKSHQDKVDENTGYVRKLTIVKGEDGVARLRAGLGFTEPDIKAMAERGTIANTSCGLKFDYQRKEDGRKFPIALDHVALTPKPWINGMEPFGMSDADASKISSLMFSEDITREEERALSDWGGALTYDELRETLSEMVEGELVDVAVDRAIVRGPEGDRVVRFSVEDGDVVVAQTESVSSSTVHETDPEKESQMPDPVKDPKDPKDDVKLSEEISAEREKNARLQAQVDQLMAKTRSDETDKFVAGLKALGLSEEAGCTEFLKEVRSVMLADTGETALSLSEEGSTDPVDLTASDLVRRLFSKLPRDEKTGQLKVALSEQTSDPLDLARGAKPPVNDDGVQLSDEEQLAENDKLFDEMFPDQHSPTTKS